MHQPHHLQRGDQPARPGHRRRSHARRSLQAHHGRHRAADRRAHQEVMATTRPGLSGPGRSSFGRGHHDPLVKSHSSDGGGFHRPAGAAARDEPDSADGATRIVDWPDGGAAAPHRREADALRLPAAEPRSSSASSCFCRSPSTSCYSVTGGPALFPSERPYVGAGPIRLSVRLRILRGSRVPAARTISGAASPTPSVRRVPGRCDGAVVAADGASC